MEKVILNAEVRETTGKAKAKEMRRHGIVPAVAYKGGKESVNLKVKQEDLFQALHTKAGENALITLSIKGAKKSSTSRTCLIKEIQRDAVKDDIVHVDFHEISLTEKIRVKVPIHPHGEAEGVVKEEGILDLVMWEVEVECLPTDIPEKITVEVAPLKIGDTIYVKDLVIPSEVKVLNDPELTVLSVVPPEKEEVVEEVPAEGEEMAEPEVIAKGKKEEEEIPEEEEGKSKKPEAPPAKEGKKE